MSQLTSKARTLGLCIPPAIYFIDTFFSIHRVQNDSMSPSLQKGDIVVIQKGDFFPYYKHNVDLTVDDLVNDTKDKITEQNNIQNIFKMEMATGRKPISNTTIYRRPPILLPGCIVAFHSPKEFGQVEISRVVGLGGQRVRPKSSLHKIEHVKPSQVYVETDHDGSGYDGCISKKLVLGNVVMKLWPPLSNSIEAKKPPLGRTWWP